MMSASEGGGGHGKADVVREVEKFYSINQIQMQKRGRGSKNLKIFGHHIWKLPNISFPPLSGALMRIAA